MQLGQIKIVAAGFSEMSAYIYQTTQSHITEDHTLDTKGWENLKPYTNSYYLLKKH
jgi:hypothetical protein